MGQYRQWLHYRQVNQQLQSQKEQLEQALARNQMHRDEIGTTPLEGDNSVILALAVLLQPTPPTGEQPAHNNHNGRHQGYAPRALTNPITSPENNLRTSEDTPETSFPERAVNSYESLPPLPHKAINLVPEDSNEVSDGSTPTEPQLALPWWLQRAALSATQSTSLDAQSIRTNRLVQRWLERWGRQEEQGTPEHHSDEKQPPR